MLFFLRTTSPGSDTRPSTRSCGKMLNIRNTGRRMYGSYLFIGIVKSIGSLQWHICRAVSFIYMTALLVNINGRTTFRWVFCGFHFVFDCIVVLAVYLSPYHTPHPSRKESRAPHWYSDWRMDCETSCRRFIGYIIRCHLSLHGLDQRSSDKWPWLWSLGAFLDFSHPSRI